MAIQVKKNIVWFAAENRLSEAVSGGLQFCMVSDKNQQCTQFFQCKDFLQDTIYGFLNNKPVSIYGFEWNPGVNPAPSVKNAKLLVANSSDAKIRNKIPNCIDFLQNFEKSVNMTPTKIFETKNPPAKYSAGGVWFIFGDKRWIASPPMLSLYSMFIRVGFGHTIGTPFMDTINGIISKKIVPYSNYDLGRLVGSINGIKNIIEKGDIEIFGKDFSKNYPSSIDVGIMHNTLGIMGFTDLRKNIGSTVIANTISHWLK